MVNDVVQGRFAGIVVGHASNTNKAHSSVAVRDKDGFSAVIPISRLKLVFHNEEEV